ncbi:MAG: hypothetical protein OXU20_36715 [Myxococcales bacterium]|nr:hypothetical protein [Myxococcales bacterium]
MRRARKHQRPLHAGNKLDTIDRRGAHADWSGIRVVVGTGETTLGGKTIAGLLETALDAGFEVRIWYVGLRSVRHHLDRVAARVQRGGHDIPQDAIRRRFDDSRRNLVRLLPRLAELKVFDNTAEASPVEGHPPRPVLVLHWRAGQIIAPADLHGTPNWAKPIVAKALALQP